MKKGLIFFMLAAFAVFSFFLSCGEKIKNEITDDDLQVVEEDNLSENVLENLDNTIDEEIYTLDQNGYATTKSLTDDGICKTITVDKPDTGLARFPKVITIDYGDGCTTVINGDSITKKGKLTITLTGRYFVKNSKRTVEFNNFSINNVKIEGTRTFTNNGLNDKGNYSWTIELKNGKITFNDTAFLTFESTRIRELVTNKTATRTDDYFLITGSESGTTVGKKTYQKTITDTLQKNFGCPVFVKGKIENKIGNQTFTVDFGDGTCDRLISVTKDGVTKTVDVRWKWRRRKA